ncbi:unnamed protein product [Blepharisma stoltei]|uniref:Uncharacterized protein n=1 Tax=Blepharisma stoltei TaxID=1481888 RepID=A0AAU9IVU7_9CILI|nr:unnamed protein product [Blepharisma stoltei]
MIEDALFSQLETRVRKLIKELIEPINNRVANHKDYLKEIQKHNEFTKTYIEGLESSINSLNHKVALVDDYSKKFMEFEAQQKLLETKFIKENENVLNHIDLNSKRLSHVEEKSNVNCSQIELLRIDITKFASDLKSVRLSVDEKMFEYKEINKKAQNEFYEKLVELQNRIIGVEINYNQLSRDLCEVDVTARKAERIAEQIKEGHKTIGSSINKMKLRNKENIMKVQENLSMKSQELEVKINEMKNYIKVDHTISLNLGMNETLFSIIIDPRMKRKLAEYEQSFYEKWEALGVSEEVKEKIIKSQLITSQILGTPIPPSMENSKKAKLKDQSSASSLASSAANTRKVPRRNYISKRGTFQSIAKEEKQDSNSNRSMESSYNEKKIEQVGQSLEAKEEIGKEKYDIITKINEANNENQSEINSPEPIVIQIPEIAELSAIEKPKTPEETFGKRDNISAIIQESKAPSVYEPKSPINRPRSPIAPKSPVHEIKAFNDSSALKQSVKSRSPSRKSSNHDFDYPSPDIKPNLYLRTSHDRLDMSRKTDISPSIDYMSFIQDLQSKIDDIIENQEIMRSQADEVQDIQDEIRGQLDEIRDHIGDLITQYEETKYTIDDDKEVQESILGQIDELREFLEEIKTLHDQLSELQSQNFKTVSEKIKFLEEDEKNQVENMKKECYEMTQNVSNGYKTVELLVMQALNECNAVINQRKRDHSDTITELKSMKKTINESKSEFQSYIGSILFLKNSIESLFEYAKINNALLMQDETDRKAISLLGIKEKTKNLDSKIGKAPVAIDKQCLSCAGQVASVVSAFKIACLNYSSNPVTYRNNSFERKELIDLQLRLIESSLEGYDSNRQDASISRSITPTLMMPRQNSASAERQLYRSVSPSPEFPPLSKKSIASLL